MAVPRSAAVDVRFTGGSLAARLTHAGQFSVLLAVEPPILKCLAIDVQVILVVSELYAGADRSTAVLEIALFHDPVEPLQISVCQRDRVRAQIPVEVRIFQCFHGIYTGVMKCVEES